MGQICNPSYLGESWSETQQRQIHKALSEKQLKRKRGRGVAQVVESLSGKSETLSLNERTEPSSSFYLSLLTSLRGQ
jgi:hypothetical protein